MTSALSVSGLTKRYGDRTVVDGLDIDLPTGVVAGFVGPNGAGKTTTMAMLLGLVRPTAGSGTVLGSSIDDPASYLHRVGALIEAPAFYPSLTGVENLRVFATVGRHDPAAIPALLETVGLNGRGDDRYRTYSLGMKQRLGIAAALLGDPELLVLDEPANGLDPVGITEMRELIGLVASGGRTVLVSSHLLGELEHVCDWLLIIDDGRLVYAGEREGFSGRAGHEIVLGPLDPADLLALADLVAAHGHDAGREGGQLVLTGPGDGASPGLAAQLNTAAAHAGIALAEVHVRRPTLEASYLRLLEGEVR